MTRDMFGNGAVAGKCIIYAERSRMRFGILLDHKGTARLYGNTKDVKLSNIPERGVVVPSQLLPDDERAWLLNYFWETFGDRRPKA